MVAVNPLGVLSPKRRGDFALNAADLLPWRDKIDPSIRASVAGYLRTGIVILAIMEYTTDVIGGAFGVSGGSGIMTDGRFYWRGDAADYVDRYGIGIDIDALKWMESNGWRVPELSTADVEKIDAELYELLRRR